MASKRKGQMIQKREKERGRAKLTSMFVTGLNETNSSKMIYK